MCSSGMQKRKNDMLLECAAHQDCTHIAGGGLVRPCRRIQGQEDYRCSKQRRNSAPIADDEAKRRVVSIRSRTGAPIVGAVLPDEKATSYRHAILKALPEVCRAQVRTFATDDPSYELYKELNIALPNLDFLVLDPVHLCIVYESAHNRRLCVNPWDPKNVK